MTRERWCCDGRCTQGRDCPGIDACHDAPRPPMQPREVLALVVTLALSAGVSIAAVVVLVGAVLGWAS